jgi:hypothetical protein
MHTTVLACILAFDKTGINIAINSAITAITAKSSINVNPLRLYTVKGIPFFVQARQ